MLHISMQTPSMLSGVEQPNLAGLGFLSIIRCYDVIWLPSIHLPTGLNSTFLAFMQP